MNVTIENFSPKYAKDSYVLRNNPRLWEFMESEAPLPATLESETAYLAMMEKYSKNKSFAILADGKFVGFITLKNIAFGAAELSYCIMDESYWGKGITSKATRLALAVAYEQLKLDLVYIYINPQNVASYKNMTNKHFVRVGISFLDKNVERLEMTRVGWEKVLK